MLSLIFILVFTKSITEVHTRLHSSCYLVCTELTCHRPSGRRGAHLSPEELVLVHVAIDSIHPEGAVPAV